MSTREIVSPVPAHVAGILDDPDAIAKAFDRHIHRVARSEGTARKYSQKVQLFLRWVGAQPDLDLGLILTSPVERDIAAHQYRRYLMVNCRQAPSSVDLSRAAIGALCEFVGFDGKPAWPAASTQKREGKATKLDDREVSRLLRTAEHRGPRDLAMVAILYYTLARVGEACSLDLGDLAIRDRSGVIEIRHGKGGKHRQIELSTDARTATRPYYQQRFRETGGEARAPLFVSKYGTRLTEASMRKALKACGMNISRDGEPVRIHPHGLRATAATRMRQNGVDVVVIQDTLGHADLNTTRIYMGASSAERAAALESLSGGV